MTSTTRLISKCYIYYSRVLGNFRWKVFFVCFFSSFPFILIDFSFHKKLFFSFLIMFLKSSENTLNSILKYTYVIFMALGLFWSYCTEKSFSCFLFFDHVSYKRRGANVWVCFVTLYMNNVKNLKQNIYIEAIYLLDCFFKCRVMNIFLNNDNVRL